MTENIRVESPVMQKDERRDESDDPMCVAQGKRKASDFEIKESDYNRPLYFLNIKSVDKKELVDTLSCAMSAERKRSFISTTE